MTSNPTRSVRTPRPRGPDFVETALADLEHPRQSSWPRSRSLFAVGVMAVFTGTATIGGHAPKEPDELAAKLEAVEAELVARRGELALARLELDRLQDIHKQSGRFGIPADLAAAIYDIAMAEGIDPDVAFSLVRVESRFASRAVSEKGAVGLTQVMPTTAFELQPGIQPADLFDEKTNLRLGFRYLRQMIRQYDGDLRLALLAYNRGPGRVDEIRQQGGDPSNGYARRVLRGPDD